MRQYNTANSVLTTDKLNGRSLIFFLTKLFYNKKQTKTIQMTSFTASNTKAEAVQTNTNMSSSSTNEPNQKKRSSSIIRWSMVKHNQADTGLYDRMNLMIAAADTADSEQKKKAPASVPLIDISSFTATETTEEEKAKCVNEILSACMNVGFFKIAGHGVPEEIINNFAVQSRRFFEQPAQIKELAADPEDSSHGYYAKENLNAALGREGAPDIREGYAIGPSEDCDFFENLWPPTKSCGDGFQMSAKSYYNEMEKLEAALSLILTRALKKHTGADLPDDWIQKGMGRHRGLLRPNYYPPSSGNIAGHTDWSTFTILHASGPGLEVVQEEEWRQVPYDPAEKSFVINCGDILERWSNGAFKSSIHRVNRSSVPANGQPEDTKPRISFAYFAAEIVDSTDHSVVQPIIKQNEKRVFEEDLSILDYMTRNFEGLTLRKHGKK